jgi:hypothetical protein
MFCLRRNVFWVEPHTTEEAICRNGTGPIVESVFGQLQQQQFSISRYEALDELDVGVERVFAQLAQVSPQTVHDGKTITTSDTHPFICTTIVINKR